MKEPPFKTRQEYYDYLESNGHSLIKENDGSIDIFACDDGIHNGPGCVKCGQSWCHHCQHKAAECSQKP